MRSDRVGPGLTDIVKGIQLRKAVRRETEGVRQLWLSTRIRRGSRAFHFFQFSNALRQGRGDRPFLFHSSY